MLHDPGKMCYVTQPGKTPRDHTLPAVRVTAAGLAHIDSHRGTWTRSEYVRAALALAARQDLTGPQEQTP